MHHSCSRVLGCSGAISKTPQPSSPHTQDIAIEVEVCVCVCARVCVCVHSVCTTFFSMASMSIPFPFLISAAKKTAHFGQ